MGMCLRASRGGFCPFCVLPLSLRGRRAFVHVRAFDNISRTRRAFVFWARARCLCFCMRPRRATVNWLNRHSGLFLLGFVECWNGIWRSVVAAVFRVALELLLRTTVYYFRRGRPEIFYFRFDYPVHFQSRPFLK